MVNAMPKRFAALSPALEQWKSVFSIFPSLQIFELYVTLFHFISVYFSIAFVCLFLLHYIKKMLSNKQQLSTEFLCVLISTVLAGKIKVKQRQSD